MPDFITLSCPSCGHKLQITPDIDRFACAACGNEHFVNRIGGIVSLKPVVDEIKGVKVGVDKTASELAIVRLQKEIVDLEYSLPGIRPNVSDGCTGQILGWVFSFIAIVCLIAILIINADKPVNYEPITYFGIGLIISIILAITSFSSGSRASKKYKRELEEMIQPVKDKLESKKRELVEHKEIVSKYK
jgi:hypothetical protein